MIKKKTVKRRKPKTNEAAERRLEYIKHKYKES